MESLVVFAKSPIAGRAKTRLAVDYGDAAAARLYAAFLEDMLPGLQHWNSSHAGVDPNRRLILYCDPGVDDIYLLELARRAGAHVAQQPEGDLGERLRVVFETEFERGARSVCAIGSDSPTLPGHLLDHAFRALLFERAVLGPTFDGGYWLIGAQRPGPDLFTDIPWSTSTVTERTLAHLRSQGVKTHLLPFWYDIDEPGDLTRLVWHLRQARARDESVHAATWAALDAMGALTASEEST